KLVAAARESGISRSQVKAVLDAVKNKSKGEISHAKSKAQNKKPTKPLDSNSDVKTWQVVVEIDGQQGVIMTDRAPDEAGYVWVKLEIGEISVEASELRVKGMRSL
ncbi:TPA: chromosome partitioning protein ParB, partial [Klebsiella pneumoniae]